MKFLKKRNLQENEELMHVPSLHWFYTVKYMILSLPIFVVLLVLWSLAEDYAASGWFPGVETAEDFQYILKYAFLAAVLLVLVVFICRICMFICVEYGVTNKRLMIKRGVLRVVATEIPIDKIESISCIQGLLGMIFNYGTLCVSGIGGNTSAFRMVGRPYALRRKIVKIIEKNKAITVVHGELPRVKPPEPVEEEPIYRYGTFVKVLKN